MIKSFGVRNSLFKFNVQQIAEIISEGIWVTGCDLISFSKQKLNSRNLELHTIAFFKKCLRG